ncbi:MAG: phosphoribosylformylglycinamidine cyclo-ligase [Candidatus Micrarchaeota archaeon]|nr:phosphoribosylformylglycinamidine cyclo-ligase [Candidatus Micrarchaeota archaeon]
MAKARTYASAGVDIRKVKSMHESLAASFFSEIPDFVLPIKGHYAGLFKSGSQTLAIHCDGVGSKILVADWLGKYDTVGIDCVAMNVNDIICIGAKPLVLVDYIALAKEDALLVRQIMKGLQEGARQARCAIIGGETAILPDMIKGGKRPFDLAATCVGVVEKKPLTGEEMKPQDAVVGLESSGLHSNGYSLARRLLGKKWWGEMLAPTRIYVKPVLEMLEACQIHGLAHITGGAFSKLMRIGNFANVGFRLDRMPKTWGIMRELEEKVRDDYEFHRTFNAGIGMCVVCPMKQAGRVIRIAGKHGIKAWLIGKATDEQDVVLEKGGKKISLL